MSVCKHSLSCILWEHLCFNGYRHYVSHLFDARLKKKTLFKMQKVAKKVSKKLTPSNPVYQWKRFSILNRNSIVKITVYAQNCYEVKNKIPSIQRGRPPPAISNGLVGNFVVRCNPDSFLWHWCENIWYGLPNHVKWCLNTSEGNCIHRLKTSIAFSSILCPLSRQKKQKMVARACSRFHQNE